MASRDVKVGLFVLLSLLILGVVVFLIGDERNLFEKHTEVRAAFKDVKGLSRGSPVRMGGVDIGAVSELGYGSDSKDDTIYVEMTLVSREARRIRKDSIAEVADKGLLGDKMIVISVGSENAPQLAKGEMIPTKETRDIEQILSDMKGTVSSAERVMHNLETTTDAFAEESFHEDIKRTMHELSEISHSVNEGEGYVGRLLNDGAEADRISKTIENVQKATAELEALLASTRQIVERVRTGPGFAHGVIYDEKGTEAISQVGGAAEEMGLALKGIREGKSLASEVLYGEDSGEMVDNMNRATEDFRAIVADVRQGKGTLGAFLTDPSVYDDIKVLLGNVGRNRSLRALVRYSIKQDEQNSRVIDTKPQGEAAVGASTETGGGVSASGGGGIAP
jgi:phospholipid/cholesterol/gamma-HCH transport system substrate-binding protein